MVLGSLQASLSFPTYWPYLEDDEHFPDKSYMRKFILEDVSLPQLSRVWLGLSYTLKSNHRAWWESCITRKKVPGLCVLPSPFTTHRARTVLQDEPGLASPWDAHLFCLFEVWKKTDLLEITFLQSPLQPLGAVSCPWDLTYLTSSSY